MVSAARLRSVVWAFQVAAASLRSPEASGAGRAARSCRDPGSRGPEGDWYPPLLRGCWAVYLAGPRPCSRGPAHRARRDWTTGLSISGDFPRGGAAGPLALPGPSPPSPEPGGVPLGPLPRHPVTPSLERPWSPCLTRREGAVPPGPHPQVSRPGLSQEGAPGRESETGRPAPRRWPGMAWEARPRRVAWGFWLPGGGAPPGGSGAALWGIPAPAEGGGRACALRGRACLETVC